MIRALFLSFLAALPLTANSSEIENLDHYIQKVVAESDAPGTAVSVVKGSQTLLSKGYGVANIKSSAPVNADTIFQLASVSKAFTAAALAVEFDKGKLEWDAPVIEKLPQFVLMEPYPTRYATTRDLLAHRTGLPPFGGDLLGKMGLTDSEILYRARFIKPANSFRNRAYYSNMGYFIAGELLATLTKSSWEESVQKNILTPLKMSRSGFAANLDGLNVASPYVLEKGQLKVIPWDRTGGFPAAGAVTSTAGDMAKWMMMFLDKKIKILKPETIKELFAPSIVGEISFSEAPPISDSTGFNFAMGWDSYYYKGYYIVEKGGGLDGMRSVTTLIPELGLGITVLTNLNLTLLPEVIRARFLEEYLGKADGDIEKEFQEKQEQLDKLLTQESKPKETLPPSRTLENYSGDFYSDLYGIIKISLENNILRLHAGPADYTGTLTHWSNNTFILTWPTVNMGHQEVIFTIGPDGNATEMQTETLGIFKKVKS